MPRIDVSSLTLSRSFSRSRRIRSRASSPSRRKKAVASFISPNIYIVMSPVKTRARPAGPARTIFHHRDAARGAPRYSQLEGGHEEGTPGMPYATDGLVGKLAVQKGMI